jgi:hypothetical protein
MEESLCEDFAFLESQFHLEQSVKQATMIACENGVIS